MITGKIWNLLDDDSMKRIDKAAVKLLTKTGCRIEHEELLDLLESHGCRIEQTKMRCYFTEKLIREAVTHLAGDISDEVSIPEGWNPQLHLGLGGSYPHFLDWPSGKRRLATKEDVINIIKMAQVLDEFTTVGKVLTCQEVSQPLEPLWAALQIAQLTNKNLAGGEVFYAEQVEPLVRLGEAWSGEPGDTRLVSACDFFIAPLILENRQAQMFMEKRRFGIKNVPGTMPISGLSAPVTIAGTVAVCIAELLAGWILGYVVNPELPAAGIVASGSLDMRTANACFGSPEALLQDFSTIQICRRLYGINIIAAVGYVDCKRPGLEAVFQKMLPLVGAPFENGFTVGGGGLLSAGQDYSPVQHLLDAEIVQAVERFTAGYAVNEDTLAIDLIEQIARQSNTNFLDTPHTRKYFRSVQWFPRWFDRTLWQGTEIEVSAEHKMLQQIDQYWKDAVARYKQPEIDQRKIKEMQKIYQTVEDKLSKL